MIGVILKTMEAYTAFMSFRKEWFVPTVFILDSQDIDDSIDLIITDTQLFAKSTKILIYGKDIKSFYDLSNYVNVVKAIPIGTQYVVDSRKLKSILPDIEFEDSLFESLYADFSDMLYDSREMNGITFDTTGMDKDAIEIEKQTRIARILAERATAKAAEREAALREEQRLKEENERKEALLREQQELERKKQLEEEEARRKKELAELEARRQEELAKAKAELEKLKLETEHQKELAAIKLEAEQLKRQTEIEQEQARIKAELEAKENKRKAELERRQLELKAKQFEATYRNTAEELEHYELNGANSVFISKPLIAPIISSKYLTNFGTTNVLRIGRKSARKSRVFLFAGAMDGCGSSTVAYNFAYSLAGTNSSTVLVDLDLQEAGLSKRFNPRNNLDCAFDACLSGEPFNSYISNIDDHVLKISIGRRRLPFISCNTMDCYSSENKNVIREFDFEKYLIALTSRYDNVVVDIGVISQIDRYQSKLMGVTSFKKFVCCCAKNQSELVESAQNIYNVRGQFSIVLSNADDSVKRMRVEQQLHRPVVGVIPFNGRFIGNSILIYSDSDNDKLVKEWKSFMSSGGV